MLRNKSIHEIWKLINWAVRLDLRAADAMNIATANRIIIECITGLAIMWIIIQIMLFAL